MAKGQKSSASSATRKKHARKAAGGEQPLPLPKEKKDKTGKKGKGKHAEPRQKIFIPPSKPAPVRPDPLMNSGIASKLPPELLVVLRRIAKKDPTTRQKALEELNTNWLARMTAESEVALAVALPVWLHHAPTLFLSAARRTRLLATQSHFLWLKVEGPRSRLVQLLRGEAPPSQFSAIIGAWRMAAEENDRAIAISARRSWDLVFCKPPVQDDDLDLGLTIPLDAEILDPLVEFVQRVLLSPADVHSELNPIQPSVEPILPPHAARSKGQGGSRQTIRLAKPVKEEDESPHLTEEDEELVEERNGRLRVGALGVLRWLLELSNSESLGQLNGLFSSPLFWTGLYYGPSPPFCHIGDGPSSPLGKDQPVVRRATWAIATTLLNRHNGVLDTPLLTTIGPAALRSAWVEPDSNVRNEMWEPLLRLLTKHPRIWELDKTADTENSPHDDGSDSEDEDDEDETAQEHTLDRTVDPSPPKHEAYHEFLQFLQLACYGSPVQGYPAVVVILSTIPPSILGPYSTWTEFLTSFWAALDGRAISQASEATLFLKSLLECIVLLVQRAHALSDQQAGVEVEVDEISSRNSIVSSQAKRVWEEVAKGRLGSADAAGMAISSFLMRIHNIDPSLWEVTWLQISDSMKTSCLDSDEQKDWDLQMSRQLSFLSTIRAQAIANPNSSFSEKLLHATESLVREIALSYIEELCGLESDTDKSKRAATQLGKILETSSDSVLKDTDFTKFLDDLLLSRAANLSVVLCMSYIIHRGEPQKSRVVWDAMLEALGTDTDLRHSSLPKLLDAAESGLLPSFLQRDNNENISSFESVISSQLDDILEGRERDVGNIRRLLQTPDAFISHHTTGKLVHRIFESFSTNARQSIFKTQPSVGTSADSDVIEITNSSAWDSEDETMIRKLQASLSLISSLIRTKPESLQDAELNPLFVWFFGVGYLLPANGMNNPGDCSAQAKAIWKTALELLDNSILLSHARTLCRDLISNISSRVLPDAVLRAYVDGHLSAKLDNTITELFPSQESLDKMLQSLPSDPLDPSIAVIDPIVSPKSSLSNQSELEDALPKYDSQGYSSYSRTLVSMLKMVLDERSTLRSNLWLLRHFMVLSQAASDRRMVRKATSAYFAQNVPEEQLSYIENSTKVLMSFALAEYEGGSSWHSAIVDAFTSKKTQKSDLGGVAGFVSLVLDAALERDAIRECRVLFSTLQHVFNDAEAGDVEKWVLLSRKLEKKNPNTASSIILAVSKSGLEPPSLDRLRNELAANSLGIHAPKARTDGLTLLRRLSASTPNVDSDVAFLPQNRAVNFVKACQSWLLADEEDEDEEDEEDGDTGLELESEMTHIFQHLAPVLQLVPGAHWELFFDLIEENLENCSFTDSTSLPLLSRTLELINVLRELSVSNRALREEWSPRERSAISRLKQLVTEASIDSTTPADTPLKICWEFALGVLQDMPKSLIDHETLPQMVHLLQYPAPDAVILSYVILRRAATALTEHLVIEAGVETSDETMKFELPVQVLDVLKKSLDPSISEPNIVAYLLGWMVTFDLFENASLRLKMGYGNHLRDLDLINSSFLPVVLDLLDIGSGTKPFRLELWSIEQFYLECFETDLPLSVRLLAAHLLYRAVLHVPSLITTWWTNCRDRQLSAAFRTVITRHFSPLLINSEFAHLRESELSGDEWTIRITPVTGEVVVAFAVDEQSLEICIDIPIDYPLHPVKVREIRKLGVEDKKWRAWLLAVQQVITSQNGRVADGISLFKKNVTSHFEDQTECAICYSILSVTELSLPKKRCKTCKNRFHASCLYKWFNTSHTSSCPLCRSDFI